MTARKNVARVALGILATAAFLTPAASAGASPVTGAQASHGVSFAAGTCGRFDARPDVRKLNLKVGKPGRLTVTFTTERPCDLDVAVRPLGRDTGIVVGPAEFVRIAAPGTFTWTVTGSKKVEDLLVASIRGGGSMFGVRLPDVSVR